MMRKLMLPKIFALGPDFLAPVRCLSYNADISRI
jgi:hypothetical protein